MYIRLSLIAVVCLAGVSPADEPPSYAKQVRPFIARYCLECHSAREDQGGLNLETYAALLEGGTHGPEFTAGKADESRIVRMVEGKIKPPMPPKKAARQPKPEEVAILRAWIEAGAVDDSSGTAVVVLPEVKPRDVVPAPVTALAYRSDGKLLAAGAGREVVLIDPATGDVVGKLPGQSGKVTAVAFSRDGLQFAVAAGAPGAAGEVRLYAAAAGAPPAGQPVHAIAAHKDMIYDLTFSPDGKTLATCGYDRLVKLWDTATGQLRRELKDHSDAVYGLAFSPDGTLLASGAADRAVKVWDVSSGKRLYTLGDSTDWVYAVAWSPDGRRLAAGGVDRSIRVWEATAKSGKLLQSVFAHESAVVRLAYSADSKTIYSLSDDGGFKAWDAERMVERLTYPKQPETPLALAVRPDDKQLAVGRYDGVLALVEEATGKVQGEPLPAKPKPPALNKVAPADGVSGRTIHLNLEGKNLGETMEATTTIPGAKVVVSPGLAVDALGVELTIPATTPAGSYQLTVKTPGGQSAPLSFVVDLFPPTAEVEPNDSPRTGQKIALPATVVGSVGRAGDMDYYRFEATAGQEIGVQVLTAAVGSKLEPILELTDAEGKKLAESSNGLLGYSCPAAGTYAVGVRDREFRGDATMFYRLHMGDIPIATGVFPLGVQRGTEAEVRVEGVNLGAMRTVKVKAAADAAIGAKLPVPLTTPNGPPLGATTVVVGEFPEVAATAEGPPLPAPFTANGRIEQSGATGMYRFTAKKGQPLLLEVNARRLGSPLDSSLEVLDAKGQPLPRAVLRCQSKTYVTFRDHDSAGSGIRIESWNDLAVNDYLLVGGELMRIFALPKNPDDDCQFYALNGQRLGYLGTTPAHHFLGQPMYKVSIHPPGTTFPPNGFPLVTLYWRNDDGGPGFGKDSRLTFDPPADGDYQVRVGDARGEGGPLYAYRLTVRPPRPGFTVAFNPTAPAVTKGGAAAVAVTAERIDGYDGPIEVYLDNLPPGFSAPATTIPANETSTSFALYAEPTAAAVPATAPPLKLIARAKIDGQDVTREAAGGLPKLEEPGDIVTTTEQSEVTASPGAEVRVTVKVERRNGFAGRIPVEVRGLPHGVRVLDVGLNGILVTEKETTRTFVIYVEPWVEPTAHPFVVLAKQEGKNAEYAAKSVLLRVQK